jgi:hypothetical protein
MNKLPTYRPAANEQLAKAKQVIEYKTSNGVVFATKVIYSEPQGDQHAQKRS